MERSSHASAIRDPDRSAWRAEMMGLAQSGDATAYRSLLEDLSQVLRRYFTKHVRADDDVEDLVQDTLVSVHRGRHTFDADRPLEPWLFAIARNTKTDYLRRTLTRQTWEVLFDEQPEQVAAEEVPADLLTEALESLPETQRRAFQHLKLDGRSVQEAAAIEGTSEGNLRVRAHRAYRSIKAALSK